MSCKGLGEHAVISAFSLHTVTWELCRFRPWSAVGPGSLHFHLLVSINGRLYFWDKLTASHCGPTLPYSPQVILLPQPPLGTGTTSSCHCTLHIRLLVTVKWRYYMVLSYSRGEGGYPHVQTLLICTLFHIHQLCFKMGRYCFCIQMLNKSTSYPCKKAFLKTGHILGCLHCAREKLVIWDFKNI